MLRMFVIPALPSADGFSAVYLRDRTSSHVEGQEGEVVAKREGRDAHRREERRERARSQNRGIDVRAVRRVAVDEKDDEGEEEGEDAEERDEHERSRLKETKKGT